MERDIENIGVKKCKKCGEEKALSEFYDTVKSKSGKHARCIECAKEDFMESHKRRALGLKKCRTCSKELEVSKFKTKSHRICLECASKPRERKKPSDEVITLREKVRRKKAYNAQFVYNSDRIEDTEEKKEWCNMLKIIGG